MNELQISRAEGNKPFWAVNNTVDEPYTEEDVEDSWMLHPLQRVVKREGIALRDALAGTRLLNMSISGEAGIECQEDVTAAIHICISEAKLMT